MSVSDLVLWLFVVNLGVVFGAGCYEARIVVPMWASAPPASLHAPDSGRAFWGFVSTVPLTLLTLASLPIAWHAREQRQWWLIAAVVALAERIATFGYFIPTMIRMGRATEPSPELRARIVSWQRLNVVRLLATLIAWLAASNALRVLE
jgi:hypothetical protein